MTAHPLQHVIYGYPVTAHQAAEQADILAISDDFNAEHLQQMIDQLPVRPLPRDQAAQSQSVAYFRLDLSSSAETEPVIASAGILARAHFQRDDQALAVYEMITLAADSLTQVADIRHLMSYFDTPIPIYNVTNAPLASLQMPEASPHTPDQHRAALAAFYQTMLASDIQTLWGLLGALLCDGLVIAAFPLDTEQRLQLIQGLSLCLPTIAQRYVTFSTYSDESHATAGIRIRFDDHSTGDGDGNWHWQQPTIQPAWLDHPYVAYLRAQWDGEIEHLTTCLYRLDQIASALWTPAMSLDAGLAAVISRYQLDQTVLAGETVASEALIAALGDTAVPMPLDLHRAYLEHLLKQTFANRDNAHAEFIAQHLDAHPDLTASLSDFFDAALTKQPDAVYAFVRVKLGQSEGDPDPSWLRRLHEAAQLGIEIVLESGDPIAISNWLTLIAREPLRYGLTDILQTGLIAAQTYASESAPLAQTLIALAVRRQPSHIEVLLNDEQLIAALPPTVRSALLDHDSEAIERLVDESRSLFLLAITRAIPVTTPTITSAIVRALWQFSDLQKNTLPAQFRPLQVLQEVIDQQPCLTESGLASLLALLLVDPQAKERFMTAAQSLSQHEAFSSALSQAIQHNQIEVERILSLLSSLSSQGALSYQQVVDLYGTLLTERDWNSETLGMAEQMARVMAQHPDTNTPVSTLWRLLELSGTQKNEQMLKVSQRRLFQQISELATDAQIVESVQRLRKDGQWSSHSDAYLLRWWRAYARDLGSGQLQKLDKALDGKRTLEDLRAIIHTSLAMQRLIGKHSLSEFAALISSAHSLLQTLSDGFDTDRLVDSETIREEMALRADQIEPQERPILSTNLRELAQLIHLIAENRSKPTLIRNEDAIERALIQGEQDPHSASDVLRWLSGYLDGSQKNHED